MSSRPDPADLEGFIEDSFFLDRMMPGSRERLIRFYEPHRKQIECAMNEDYDPETMSWRDWRNAYWGCLPEPPLKEIKMSDEEVRGLERAATHDPEAMSRLTLTRFRRTDGVVWLWVAEHGCRIDLGGGIGIHTLDRNPVGPPGAMEVKVIGFRDGGDVSLVDSERVTPPVPTERRAWILACLDVVGAVLGREVPPEGRDVRGPFLLDLATRRLVGLSVSSPVTLATP